MTDSNSPGDRDNAYVAVVFAEDSREAEYFKSLLEDHGIDVNIGENTADVESSAIPEQEVDDNGGRGIPVRVMYETLPMPRTSSIVPMAWTSDMILTKTSMTLTKTSLPILANSIPVKANEWRTDNE